MERPRLDGFLKYIDTEYRLDAPLSAVYDQAAESDRESSETDLEVIAANRAIDALMDDEDIV